jgi:hypothetical protein
MSKKAIVVAYFEVVSQHLAAKTVETHEKKNQYTWNSILHRQFTWKDKYEDSSQTSQYINHRTYVWA